MFNRAHHVHCNQVWVPTLEFAAMHAVLLHFAIIPLTMCAISAPSRRHLGVISATSRRHLGVISASSHRTRRCHATLTYIEAKLPPLRRIVPFAHLVSYHIYLGYWVAVHRDAISRGRSRSDRDPATTSTSATGSRRN